MKGAHSKPASSRRLLFHLPSGKARTGLPAPSPWAAEPAHVRTGEKGRAACSFPRGCPTSFLPCLISFKTYTDPLGHPKVLPAGNCQTRPSFRADEPSERKSLATEEPCARGRGTVTPIIRQGERNHADGRGGRRGVAPSLRLSSASEHTPVRLRHPRLPRPATPSLDPLVGLEFRKRGGGHSADAGAQSVGLHARREPCAL